MSGVKSFEGDPVDNWSCVRKDGLDLISDWAQDKEARGATYAYVNSTGSLRKVSLSNTQYLLGDHI